MSAVFPAAGLARRPRGGAAVGRGAAVLVPLLLLASMAACAAIPERAAGGERAAGIAGYDRVRAIFSARRVATISAEVSLPVRKIRREMGQSFAEGETLVEFDSELAAANLKHAEAALVAAAASLDAVGSMYERNNASRLELETARRDKAQAEARFAQADRELRSCVVTAPFAGRVAAVLVNEFELPARGAPLIALVDDSRLTAKFLLPEEHFGGIAIGDPVAMTVAATGERVEGTISHIAAEFEPASRTFEVWAEVDNSGERLRSGMDALLEGF